MSIQTRAVDTTPRSRAGYRRRRPWIAPVLVFVGLLAVQVAWIGSLQVFRGMDEFDHAFRADSVAAGHWLSTGETTDQSRGELVSVRSSIIEAATPVCEYWPYTEYYDCHPYASDGSDRALIATAAARYNPAFYWVIGTVAKPFEGTHAVYAMRVAGAILCALLVALAFAALQQLTASTWRLAALLCVLTPTMTYSTAMAAPNGVEMAAALLTWASLLAVARSPEELPQLPRRLVVLAATGLVVLCTVRTMGPLWALLIVAAIVAVTPRSRLRTLVRDHRWPMAIIGGTWLASAIAGAAWSIVSGTNDPRTEGDSIDGSAWAHLLDQFVLWTLQSMGAFPARDERAPVIIYALFVVATAVVLGLGVRYASRRTRFVMVAIVAAVVVLSATITVLTYATVGYAWQGRYIWPLSMGVPLLAGLSITRTTGRRAWLLIVTGLVAGATAISQVAVQRRDLADERLPDGSFLPAYALVALTVAGFALMFVADLYAGRPTHQHPTDELVR